MGKVLLPLLTVLGAVWAGADILGFHRIALVAGIAAAALLGLMLILFAALIVLMILVGQTRFPFSDPD
jgi:hypothetical protein